MILTGAQIICEVLLENCVDTIFGYPGGAVLPIYDSLYSARDRLAHVLCAHEQGSAHAADGYARASGKIGVVISTSGPGATNLVTGIAAAYMDSTPMVIITGNVATDHIGRDSFQEVYIAGITMPITKHNFVIRDVRELADTLRRAFCIANSGRKGPVLIDVPRDITEQSCEFEKSSLTAPLCAPMPPESILDRAADIINAAKTPVIYFGGGVASANAGEELCAFMKKANCPAAHTMMAAGVLRFDENSNLGMLGLHGTSVANTALKTADVIIAAGCRFSDRIANKNDVFSSDTTVIQIDIDESEINKNIGVDLWLNGDVKAVLAELCARVCRDGSFERIDNTEKTASFPHEIFEIIAKTVDENTVYTTDVGQHQVWAAQYAHHLKPHRFLTSGGLGAMGFGYGAAIGASVALCDTKIVHITGDGSFHMNMNEASTAVTYNLPIITVIFNNSSLGMVRQQQDEQCGSRHAYSEIIRKTDYVKVGEGFGTKTFRATTPHEFEVAFKSAVAVNGPVWIECIIDKGDNVYPSVSLKE